MSVPTVLTAGPDGVAVREAAAALDLGAVVGIPTDTVYGLAVNPFEPGATARIFAAKDRPRAATIAVLVAGQAQVDDLCAAVPAAARRLMARWWPGPLTIVLDRKPGLEVDLGEDTASVGLRCADHPVPLALTGLVGPIATTSANPHGAPPLTSARALADTLPSVTLVVDAGRCDGAPSTVVDCRGGALRLLRAGPIAWESLEASSRS